MVEYKEKYITRAGGGGGDWWWGCEENKKDGLKILLHSTAEKGKFHMV